MRAAFIVSTGRTGTRFLAEFLNEIDGVVAVHEPAPRLFALANDVARGLVSPDAAIEQVGAARLGRMRNVAYYVEANNRLWSLTAALRYCWPGCRLVRVVRDGRDVVRSGMARGWYAPNDPFDRIRAPEIPDDPWADRWNTFSRFQKVCWWWVAKDRRLLSDLAGLGDKDRMMTVRFEDIFGGDYGGMHRLLEFLDLEDAADRVTPKRMAHKANATPDHHFPHWTEWNETYQMYFDAVAGEHLRGTGYSWT